MKPAASNDEILEFCNKVREAGGGKPLDALLPGVPEDAHSCLIANNLNFQCRVGGLEGRGVTDEDQALIRRVEGEGGRWWMTLENEEVRDRIAEALDLEKVDTGYYWENPYYSVLLPKKIGNVAWNFDQANQDFFYSYQKVLDSAEERGLSETEAHATAWEHASANLTEAMKRYAKLTTVVEHG